MPGSQMSDIIEDRTRFNLLSSLVDSTGQTLNWIGMRIQMIYEATVSYLGCTNLF